MQQIIITADDFGLCEEINEAVECAHREGILSAASLMVSAPAAADAIERARRLPRLRVGLHLVLVDGRPTLPPTEIPSLVEASGAFLDDLVGAGIRWFFLPAARCQLEQEIEAQFEAFRATGLRLDHVNAHNHMHVHPTILGIVLRLASRYTVPSIRLPYEPAAVARALGPPPTFVDHLRAALVLVWAAVMRHRIEAAGLRHNDTLLGLRASGQLNTASILALLERLPDGVAELYCHPATRRTALLAALMPGYDNEAEFAALVSPLVRERVHALNLRPVGFTDLGYAG